ncbi:hypothetical protein QBC42DRAFT_288076 [Cladorrhinum samala]|uniref:C2H2-type domain-containing protein n=1 Tax=Cladorrhinum samala TaxID=585594 RepID=A0AAV9HLM0_9PEZI|nr:hypothetical protein QBC42DRAFT_288076 [Cladorrhinum samala]
MTVPPPDIYTTKTHTINRFSWCGIIRPPYEIDYSSLPRSPLSSHNRSPQSTLSPPDPIYASLNRASPATSVALPGASPLLNNHDRRRNKIIKRKNNNPHQDNGISSNERHNLGEVTAHSSSTTSTPEQPTGLHICIITGCRYSTNSGRDREKHLATVHSKGISRFSYTCPNPGCGKLFGRSDNGLRHTRNNCGFKPLPTAT